MTIAEHKKYRLALAHAQWAHEDRVRGVAVYRHSKPQYVKRKQSPRLRDDIAVLLLLVLAVGLLLAL